MLHVTVQGKQLKAEKGCNLMDLLRREGVFIDAPCGGHGQCGKCRVVVEGREVLACETSVDRDMTVTVPPESVLRFPQPLPADGNQQPAGKGYMLAFDIGTTSVVCYLLDGKTGVELARSSMLNPQTAYGADVVTRIRAALQGTMEQQTKLIREGMAGLIRHACREAGISPEEVSVVSVVGNPAMQQLFLGISPENLAAMPFRPVLTEAKTVPCQEMLPLCPNARLQIVPDISGYIGADTVSCVLATGMHQKEEITLLVDIGTNGEMVLGNKERMIACSTAAGPALEGANIRFGMRAAEGAIDRVWLDGGKLQYSVIGGGEARGICGSGLIDAVAVGLQTGLLNKRGRIQNEEHVFRLTDAICLTQDDIRQVQLAKGAIYAGICLMAKELSLDLEEIQQVQLAGAFGSNLDPESACRIGLLPEELGDRIEIAGNAAGSGAKMLARDPDLLSAAQLLTEKIEFLELAVLPEFAGTFARGMNFREGKV